MIDEMEVMQVAMIHAAEMLGTARDAFEDPLCFRTRLKDVGGGTALTTFKAAWSGRVSDQVCCIAIKARRCKPLTDVLGGCTAHHHQA